MDEQKAQKRAGRLFKRDARFDPTVCQIGARIKNGVIIDVVQLHHEKRCQNNQAKKTHV